MKKCLLLLSCLMSVQSFALVCESDNGSHVLKMKEVSKELVKVEVGGEEVENIFVGKKLSYKNFTLFNQEGFKFKLTKNTFGGLQACRTLDCPTLPIETLIKLEAEGKSPEYFTCL